MKNTIKNLVLSTAGVILLAFPGIVYNTSSFFLFGEAETPEFLIKK